MPNIAMPDIKHEIELRLLGCVDVRRNGVPVSGFRSYKVLALLCHLALQNKPVLRTVLADLFWPMLEADKAGAELRRALNNLGTLLPGCLQADKLNVTISTCCNNDLGRGCDDDNGDTGNATHVYFDVAHAKALFAQDTAQSLMKAVVMSRGDLMAGFTLADCPDFEAWLTAEREQWRQQVARAYPMLIDQLIHQRQHTRAVEFAQQAVALDPWREDAHRKLMLLLARTGQRSAGLEQYQKCRAILKAELGIEPDAETTALYERIRTQSGQAVRPATLQASHYAAHEGELIGRAADLAQVLEKLDAPAGQLVTLIGPGGMGKTTLAMQVLAERGRNGGHTDFINGTYFVPLAPISANEYLPTALATAVATAIGLSFTGSDEPKTQLLRLLANQELLLVLDNFEHLSNDPNAAQFVADVLRCAPLIKIVVTSRVRLGLPSEWVIELDGLSVPAIDATSLADLEASGAGQLFLRSAGHMQPAFARKLNVDDMRAIARICRLTWGMPLALEMAASWVRVLPCTEIADEIQRNLDFLESTHSGTPARHRSMRAVFNHSWALLSEPEREAFARLSVFRGGFTREAAARVTGATLTQLLAFMDQSLVRRSEAESDEKIDRQADRFEVHELLRQFAEEKLATALPTPVYAAVRDAHCAYYAEWTQARYCDMTGPNIRTGCDAILRELENVRASWHWAAQHRRAEVLLRMTDTLILFYDVRCLFEEGERMYGLAVDALEGAADDMAATSLHTATLGTMLGSLAWVRWQRLHYAEARELVERGLFLLRRSGDQPHLAKAMFVRAAIAATSGDYANALKWYHESNAIFTELGEAWGMATTLFSLAQFAVAQGQPVVVETHLQQSLVISNRSGDVRSRAFALMALGNKHAEEGRHQAAREELQTALALFEKIQGRRNIASAQVSLARLLATLGQLDAAQDYAQGCLDLCAMDQYELGMSQAHHHLSVVALARGHFDAAWAHGQHSLALATKSSDLAATAEAYNALSEAALAATRWDEARQFAMQANEIARTANVPMGVARAEANLARVPAES